jgi:nitrogenase molybdenum-iron protein alpha/beta subunit
MILSDGDILQLDEKNITYDIKFDIIYVIYMNNNDKEICLSFILNENYSIKDLIYGDLTDDYHVYLSLYEEFLIFINFIKMNKFKDYPLMKQILDNKLNIDFEKLELLKSEGYW